MLAPTHLVLGQASFLAAAIATAHTPEATEALAAAVFALLPDLDKRQSYVGRVLPFISEPLDYHFGHRTVTHSLLLQCLVACLLYRWLPYGWWLALVCGLVSHSVGDMLTPNGVAWFWPSLKRCVLPGNARYRIKPMSWAELWFAVLVTLLTFALVPLSQEGGGTTGLIRQAIGDIRKARQDYDAGKGTHAWRLQLQGRDNRSHADIAGEYPVIGPWGEGGFILHTVDGPRAVCHLSSCDWYAEHARLIRGEPQQTTVRALETSVVSVASLLDSLLPLQSAGEVYLLGTFQAQAIRELRPTIQVTGEAVTLHYASPSDLEPYRDRMLREVDLLVQIRHAPDKPVPKWLIDTTQAPVLNPLIQRWIE